MKKEIVRCKSFTEYIMAKRVEPREPKRYEAKKAKVTEEPEAVKPKRKKKGGDEA